MKQEQLYEARVVKFHIKPGPIPWTLELPKDCPGIPGIDPVPVTEVPAWIQYAVAYHRLHGLGYVTEVVNQTARPDQLYDYRGVSEIVLPLAWYSPASNHGQLVEILEMENLLFPSSYNRRTMTNHWRNGPAAETPADIYPADIKAMNPESVASYRSYIRQGGRGWWQMRRLHNQQIVTGIAFMSPVAYLGLLARQDDTLIRVPGSQPFVSLECTNWHPRSLSQWRKAVYHVHDNLHMQAGCYNYPRVMDYCDVDYNIPGSQLVSVYRNARVFYTVARDLDVWMRPVPFPSVKLPVVPPYCWYPLEGVYGGYKLEKKKGGKYAEVC